MTNNNSPDLWQNFLSWGGEQIESIGEGLSEITDSYVDAFVSKHSEVEANPQVQKEREPTKGETVEGRPIVATAAPSLLDDKTLMYGGLAVAALLVVVLAVKK